MRKPSVEVPPAELAASAEVLALPGVFALAEKANLPALSVALQFPDLFDEVLILERLAYKNKNQHRASKHHQAVCQVLRALRLFQQLQLPACLQALHTAAARTSLPEAPNSTIEAQRGGSSKRARRQQQQQQQQEQQQRQTVRLPSFAAGCFVLRRLLSGAQLLLDLHSIILTAAQHLSGQLSRGYFMPFCLVAAAAVSRIRVLATIALLELLQAYSSLVQLLPLLPAAASTAPSRQQSVHALQAISSSDGLPQMLQLAWNGAMPALRSIPFEQQGPQSLQGLAAELQQTFCISSTTSASEPEQLAGVMQQDAQQQAVGRGASDALQQQQQGGDFGVAISRDAFVRQQQQQRGQKQQRQQQQSTPAMPPISFFEDKQPQPSQGTGASAARGAPPVQQAPAAAAVPLYTTVPGLGFSLGAHHPGPDMPALLGRAAAAGAPVASTGNAGAAESAGAQAMDVDSLTMQEEFAQQYGKQQPTPSTQPLHFAPQQQQRRLAGRLQASAALLAMQGTHDSSSEDDEDMPPAAAAPPASVQQQAPPPLLLAKQQRKKKGKQQQKQQAAPQGDEPPAAPRDSILDLLLQGL